MGDHDYLQCGIDVSLWNSRVNASFDVYKRKTTDLLMNAPVASLSNFGNRIMKNIGSMENTGFEAAITVRPIQTADWHWELTATPPTTRTRLPLSQATASPLSMAT